jgi:hypothetical protein
MAHRLIPIALLSVALTLPAYAADRNPEWRQIPGSPLWIATPGGWGIKSSSHTPTLYLASTKSDRIDLFGLKIGTDNSATALKRVQAALSAQYPGIKWKKARGAGVSGQVKHRGKAQRVEVVLVAKSDYWLGSMVMTTYGRMGRTRAVQRRLMASARYGWKKPAVPWRLVTKTKVQIKHNPETWRVAASTPRTLHLMNISGTGTLQVLVRNLGNTTPIKVLNMYGSGLGPKSAGWSWGKDTAWRVRGLAAKKRGLRRQGDALIAVLKGGKPEPHRMVMYSIVVKDKLILVIATAQGTKLEVSALTKAFDAMAGSLQRLD